MRASRQGVLLGLLLVTAGAVSCSYDLDSFVASSSNAAGGSASNMTTSSAGHVSATGAGSTGASSTGTNSTGASIGQTSSSATGPLETPYAYCTSDELDDPKWDDHHSVDWHDDATVSLGPDNNDSSINWHDDVAITDCMIAIRVDGVTGIVRFGVTHPGEDDLMSFDSDGQVFGIESGAATAEGSPVELAVVAQGPKIVTAFRDSLGWHRLESYDRPAWYDKAHPMVEVPSNQGSVHVSAYNASTSALRPSDIGQPAL